MIKRQTTALREALAERKLVVAPGCYDGASAKFIEANGFNAAYLTGFGLQASLFGKPNVGFGTLTEYVAHSHNIASAIDIPLIVDAEIGFGGPINVIRSVREFEQAGVAAIHLEDQIYPWAAAPGIEHNLLSVESMQHKIRAAKYAQQDPDFVLIARTDAAHISFEEAIRRCNAYLEAGADMVMPLMSPVLPYTGSKMTYEERMDIHRRLIREIKGPILTHSPHGLDLTLEDAQSLGYAAYAMPQLCMAPAAAAMDAALKALMQGKLEEHFKDHPPMAVQDFSKIMGLKEFMDLDHRFPSIP
jgi:methylisocitrate lyase